jgi:hypothetical protein
MEEQEGRQQSSMVVVSYMLVELPVLDRKSGSFAACAAVVTFFFTAGNP